MPASDQGVNRERYMLVPRTLIFLTCGEKILFLRGAKGKRLWPGLFNGVGGHIELGEDVLSAARRELHEETGLVPPSLWLCGTITIDTQTNPGVCVFVFKGETMDANPGKSDEGTLEWVSISDINHIPLVADLPQLLPRILEIKPGEPPFSAHSKYNDAGNLEITFG